MKSQFFLFLFNILFLCNFCQSAFEIPLTQTSSGEYVANIDLGTPSTTFTIKPETSTFLFWVGESGSQVNYVKTFDPAHSSTFKNLSIPYTTIFSNGLNQGYLASDMIHLSNINATLSFALAQHTITSPSSSSDISGVLGLGYKTKNQMYLTDEFNLISVLKENKEIEKKVFSIKNYVNETTSKHEGIIHVGDYPQDFTDDEQISSNQTGFCGAVNYTTNSHQLSWNCRLSYLIKGSNNSESAFKSNNIELNETIVFDYNSKTSILREEVANKFLAAFKKSNCSFVQVSLVSKEIQCSENREEISIVFNGVALKLPKESLYEYIEETKQYRLPFTFSSEVKVSSIGQILFDNYEVLFDEELNRVGFHTDKSEMMGNVTKYTTDNDKNESNLTLIIVVSIVGVALIIGVIILLVWNLRKKEDLTKSVEKMGKEGLMEV